MNPGLSRLSPQRPPQTPRPNVQSRVVGFFRRKKEQAIPKPGTPEFDEAVEGTALPDDQSVSMGEAGWKKPEAEPAADESAPDEATSEVAEQQPDQPDEEEKPKRAGLLIRGMARGVPNQGGFGAGIPGAAKPKKPKK